MLRWLEKFQFMHWYQGLKSPSGLSTAMCIYKVTSRILKYLLLKVYFPPVLGARGPFSVTRLSLFLNGLVSRENVSDTLLE